MRFFKIRAAKFFAGTAFSAMLASIFITGDAWVWSIFLAGTIYLESWCWAWQVSDVELAEYEQYILNKRDKNDDNNIGPLSPA